VVEPVIGTTIELPEAIRAIEGKEKKAIKLKADYGDFKTYLLS
jgi:hypothetical protein